MIPTSTLDAPIVSFALPAQVQRNGLALAVAGVGCIAILIIGPAIRSPWNTLGLLLGVVLGGVGVAVALRKESLILNATEATYEYSARKYGRVALRKGLISDFSRVALRRRRVNTWDGGEAERAQLVLESDTLPIQLMETEDADLLHALGERLAARVGLAYGVADSQPTAKPKAISEKWTAAAIWICIAGIGLAVVWPVVTGRAGLGEQRFRRGGRMADRPSDFYDRGESYYRAQNYPAAEIEFRRAVTQNPYNSEAYNMLAYALADQGKLDEALKEARTATSLEPKQGFIIDTLAEMHERRGELDQAAIEYQRALDNMGPQDPLETHAKFGRTLIGLGRLLDAYPHIELAARPNKGDKWNNIARRLLKVTPWPEGVKPSIGPPSRPQPAPITTPQMMGGARPSAGGWAR